jgi:hypothetical protein
MIILRSRWSALQSVGVGKSNINWKLSQSGATLVVEMWWAGGRGSRVHVHIQVEGRPVCGKDGERRQQVLPVLFLVFDVITIRILSLSHWRA